MGACRESASAPLPTETPIDWSGDGEQDACDHFIDWNEDGGIDERDSPNATAAVCVSPGEG
jgi:hypothetical protein